MTDLLLQPAAEQAGLLRSGSLSARELVTAHLKQIERVNPTVNAIVTVVGEQAVADATLADERFASGEAPGPLHGLPVVHKDLVSTAGIRTTFGSTIFADNVPTSDALIVKRQRTAGAITLGKSNTPEFGAGSQTFNEVFGATSNPYDVARTCGGSSGGAAVALATGMASLADGSDLGGSLRNPASFCNVVGMRPSPGRVPSFPRSAAWSFLSTAGPMGRTVLDVSLFLAAIAGPDRHSPIAMERPGSDFGPTAVAESDARSMRIAWSPSLGGLPIDSQVRSALASIPDTVAALGCEIEEATPNLDDARSIFQMGRALQYELGYGALYDDRGAEMKETVRWNIEAARKHTLPDYADALRKHAALFQRVRTFFEHYDVLLCPVSQVPPFDLSLEYIEEIEGVAMETYIDWMRSCTDVSVMNCPAMSVPAGFTDDGLPVGIQMIAAPRNDLGLLQFAYAFEQATRVGDRRPELTV